MSNKTYRIIILFLAGLMFSSINCLKFTIPIELLAPINTATNTSLKTPTPIPPWLMALYPKENQKITLDEYNSSERKKASGNRNTPDIENSVCILIYADVLLEPGDYWNGTAVEKRTAFYIDGILINDPTEIYDPGVRFGYSNRSSTGPYFLCYSTSLQLGEHTVNIKFTKTSGGIEEVMYSFWITNY